MYVDDNELVFELLLIDVKTTPNWLWGSFFIELICVDEALVPFAGILE